MINMDQTEGQFAQLKGKIKETWGKLSDNDIMLYKGQREQFLGKLKEQYGLMKEDAEKALAGLEEAYDMHRKDGKVDGANASHTSAQPLKPMPGVAK